MREGMPRHHEPEVQPPPLSPEARQAMESLARHMPPESVPPEDKMGGPELTPSETTRMHLREAQRGPAASLQTAESKIATQERTREAVRQQLIELQRSAEAIAEVALQTGVELDNLSRAAIRDTKATLEALDIPK